MKHTSPDQLNVVEICPDGRTALGRIEKLERWAALLDRDPGRRLTTLPGTEYAPVSDRLSMRNADSPLSVAADDPVLRNAGLENDTYGEAKRFFELTDRQLHDIVCYCHFGATMPAATAARSVRMAIQHPDDGGLFARMRDIVRR